MSDQPVRVLAIDGGGIHGVIPARVLERVEVLTGRPISASFDLLAGSSTGGLIVLGMAAPGRDGGALFSGREAVALYRDRGAEIFRQPLRHRLTSIGGWVRPLFPAANVERMLHEVFGEVWLSEARTDVMVTAYAIGDRPVRQDAGQNAYFFKSWKAKASRADGGAGERDFAMRDAARATSAAPTYFPAARIRAGDGSLHAMIDGGVHSNNPALCAYTAALRRWPGRSVRLLSLGTGKAEQPIDPLSAERRGRFGWVPGILDVLLDGMDDTVHYQLAELMPNGHYLRLQSDLVGDADRLPSDSIVDVRPANLRALLDKADRMLEREGERLERFLADMDKAVEAA